MCAHKALFEGCSQPPFSEEQREQQIMVIPIQSE